MVKFSKVSEGQGTEIKNSIASRLQLQAWLLLLPIGLLFLYTARKEDFTKYSSILERFLLIY
jgi:hypothetical protein